jgi:hypothetical protein
MGQSGAFRLHPARASPVDKSQEFQGIYAGDFQQSVPRIRIRLSSTLHVNLAMKCGPYMLRYYSYNLIADKSRDPHFATSCS